MDKTNNKIINLIPIDISEGIDIFKSSKNFSYYLAVLNIVATTKARCDIAFDSWDKYKSEVSDGNALSSFLDWITGLNFSNDSISNITDDSFDENGTVKNQKDISDLAKVIVESFSSPSSYDEIDDKVKDVDFPYGSFMAAWPFGDLLKKNQKLMKRQDLYQNILTFYSQEKKLN